MSENNLKAVSMKTDPADLNQLQGLNRRIKELENQLASARETCWLTEAIRDEELAAQGDELEEVTAGLRATKELLNRVNADLLATTALLKKAEERYERFFSKAKRLGHKAKNLKHEQDNTICQKDSEISRQKRLIRLYLVSNVVTIAILAYCAGIITLP